MASLLKSLTRVAEETVHFAEEARADANAAKKAVQSSGEVAVEAKPQKLGAAVGTAGLLGLGGAYELCQQTDSDFMKHVCDLPAQACSAATGNTPLESTMAKPDDGVVAGLLRAPCNCTVPNTYPTTKRLLCGTLLDYPLTSGVALLTSGIWVPALFGFVSSTIRG